MLQFDETAFFYLFIYIVYIYIA